MTKEDRSLGDRLKGGFGTFGKVVVAGGLGAWALGRTLKETLVGDPPSPWRKAAVYGTAALAIGYSACSQEINTVGEKTYGYLQDQKAQRIDELEERSQEQRAQLRKKAERIDDQDDRIADLTEELSQARKTYEATIDSLTQDNTRENRGRSRRGDQQTYEATSVLGEPRIERQPRPEATPGEQHCWHPVQSGETLSSLAASYTDAPYTVVQAQNNIEDADDLPIGYPLTFDTEPCEARTTQPPSFTTLTRGESLLDDAGRVGDPADVLAYNDSLGNDLTDSRPGQRVAIYKP